MSAQEACDRRHTGDILTAAYAVCFDGSMTTTHQPNTDCGSLYVGDTVYFQDSDTIEQVEDLRWVGSAERQDLMVLTTDLSVRTVRFSEPVLRLARRPFTARHMRAA